MTRTTRRVTTTTGAGRMTGKNGGEKGQVVSTRWVGKATMSRGRIVMLQGQGQQRYTAGGGVGVGRVRW